jgi:glycosyltransferase involved in cell wall biosynthesis
MTIPGHDAGREQRSVGGARLRQRSAPLPRPEVDRVSLSVVIPIYNEKDTLQELCERLDRVLDAVGGESEIILVDDGSRDGTSEEIERLVPEFRRLRAIQLRRNFGQTAALAAGFDCARGNVVVTMDADLQNPPEEITKLLARLDEGYDLVSGWRADRQDHFLLRVFPSRVANWMIGRLTGTRLRDYGCSLKAYRREIIEDIEIHGEMHRFLPAFAGALGARITEIPVQHFPREKGRSKYGLLRWFVVLVDMISIRFLLPYSFKPLKVFGLLGIALLGSGGAISLYLAGQRLFGAHALSDRPLLLLGVLLIIMGVQLVGLGILAELQTRALHDRGRGTYAVRCLLGFDGDEDRGGPSSGQNRAARPLDRG